MPAEGEMHAPANELPIIAADVLARLRAQSPRVHCITNSVAQTLTANTLLAVGAVPSMTIAPEEIGGFVKRAGALLVNLGTFDAGRRAASAIAIEAANELNLPWVLDPVFVDRSEPRAIYAKQLAVLAPKAMRLNHAEFSALSGVAPEGGALAGYSREHGIVVGLTGATDLVADGERLVAIANGHPLMPKVTALGCAASALVAACLAVERDAWCASAAALLIMGVAGELAAKRARGPGSFAVEILDALYALDRDMLVAHAKVS
jgi:hydroxyethylthiazole kinase